MVLAEEDIRTPPASAFSSDATFFLGGMFGWLVLEQFEIRSGRNVWESSVDWSVADVRRIEPQSCVDGVYMSGRAVSALMSNDRRR
jgi:hypothetical protein